MQMLCERDLVLFVPIKKNAKNTDGGVCHYGIRTISPEEICLPVRISFRVGGIFLRAIVLVPFIIFSFKRMNV